MCVYIYIYVYICMYIYIYIYIIHTVYIYRPLLLRSARAKPQSQDAGQRAERADAERRRGDSYEHCCYHYDYYQS